MKAIYQAPSGGDRAVLLTSTDFRLPILPSLVERHAPVSSATGKWRSSPCRWPRRTGTTGTRMYVRWFPGNGDAKRRHLRIPSLCTIRSPRKRRLTPGTPKSSAAMRLRSPNSGGGAMATYFRSSEDSRFEFRNPGGGPYHRVLCATKRCAYFRCARLVRTDPSSGGSA